jgi:phytol kinase
MTQPLYDLTNFFILLVLFATNLTIHEFLYARFEVSNEYTRRTAGIVSYLICLLIPFMFDHTLPIWIGGTFFVGLTYYLKQKRFFKSIELTHQNSDGFFLMPIAVTMMFLLAHAAKDMNLFWVPVLIAGISDSLAGITSHRWKAWAKPIKIRNREFDKSYLGSLSFFVSALVIALVFLYQPELHFTSQRIWIGAFSIALGTTMAELISRGGWDNLTIPTSAGILWLMVQG